MENTYRAVNIAFANELARICADAQLDVYEIIRICNMHPRVNILQPGPGVGGHCISVDPWFLVGDYPELARMIRLARETNDSMPGYVLERVTQLMKEQGLKDQKRVGFYGLTYKENVDDVRESPTLQLIEKMEAYLGEAPKSYDPWVSTTIVNIIHFLDPEVIALGGGVSKAGDFLLDAVRAKLPQMVFYKAITDCVEKNIVTDDSFIYLIPSGTAIENALSSYLVEKDLHRDYAHATDFGRVIASYTWYCTLTGVDHLDEIKVDAIPKEFLKSTSDKTQDRVITEAEKAIILESVNNALKNPLKITQSQYTQKPAQ